MGNRAVIAFGPNKPDTIGVYLHWNGGRASVEGFLRAARVLKLRDPIGPNADCYGVARFTQMVGKWFGGDLSLGLGMLKHLDCDNGDNGMYIIGPGWMIASRVYSTPEREEINEKKTKEIFEQCVAKFPVKESA